MRYAIVMLLAAVAAQADAAVRVYGAAGLPGSVEGVELALEAGRSRYQAELAGRDTELRVNRLGIALYEPLRSWLQPGIQGGWLDVNQSGNPATGGMNLSGYFAGALLRSDLFTGAPLGVQLGLSYAYHSADGAVTGQQTRLQWQTFEARAGGVLRTDAAEWILGGYYRSVDGEQTADGAVTGTLEFAGTEDSGVYGGVDVIAAPGARVGVRVTAGAEEQISISFSRKF